MRLGRRTNAPGFSPSQVNSTKPSTYVSNLTGSNQVNNSKLLVRVKILAGLVEGPILREIDWVRVLESVFVEKFSIRSVLVSN